MDLNLVEIDRLLATWNQKIDAANQNLLELSDLSVYKQVAGMGNPPSNLAGITRQQVGAALTEIDRLFEQVELLNQTIDRARKLRQELSAFPSIFIDRDRLEEIQYLLTQASIQLPSIHQPLSQRDLLSPNLQIQAISVANLLASMISGFSTARDTLISVDRAWEKLASQSIAIDRELINIQQLVQELQVPIPPALIAVKTNFTNLQLEIDRDPLGVNDTFSQELLPLIDRTRQELATLSNQRQQLQAELIFARQRLVELQQLDRDSILANTESQAKIKHSLPIVPPLPPEELIAIEQWLTRLETNFQAGNIAPTQVGLRNWLNRVETATVAAQTALTANRLPLETRQELRGRLDALTAKAVAKRKAEDPILADLAIQAREKLYTSPTALDLAIDLVERYQQQLDRQLAC